MVDISIKTYERNGIETILDNDESVPTKIMSSFEGENIQTQYILRYRIELYFDYYKLTTEIDENGQSNRNIDHGINWQKAIEQELG